MHHKMRRERVTEYVCELPIGQLDLRALDAASKRCKTSRENSIAYPVLVMMRD